MNPLRRLTVFSLFLLTGSSFASLPPGVSGHALLEKPALSALAETPAEKRPTLLVFLSARCPCSAAHEAVLKNLHATYGEKIAFLAVHSNQDEPESEAKTYFEKAALPFPILQDAAGATTADRLGALKTPHAYLLSPTGEVLFSGGVDDSKDPTKAKRHYLADALAAVSEGKTPTEKETRTLGCVIKRAP